MNERLRDAMNKHGLRPTDLATRLDVSPKTVERWITIGRNPYPRHRSAVAALLRESESYLWPDALSEDRKAEVSEAEVISVYSHRSDVPREMWDRLVKAAEDRIDILVYAGLYLAEEHGFAQLLEAKASDGVKVRLLFGDPDSDEVVERSEEEGIGDRAMSSRIQNAMAFYSDLENEDQAEIRLHQTTLYNSILRFDDEMLVNMHIYGLVGAQAPVMHLRQLGPGELFQSYANSFENVWESAVPSGVLVL